MAEEQRRSGEEEPEKKNKNQQGASGGKGEDDLGNLPPLSDFESSEGGDLDSNLPPLENLDSDSGEKTSGGLPPLSDIEVETPQPTGGYIRPAPPGYEKEQDLETPTTDGGLDTPHGTSFQDLAADSDFSPETPEIGPGPDSDLETPMFDSAFGESPETPETPDTAAPTQAMETPMFDTGAETPSGGRDEDFGFEPGAFGDVAGAGAGAGAAAGGARQRVTVPTPPPQPSGIGPAMQRAPQGGGGGRIFAIAVIVLIVGAAIGIVVAPYLAGPLRFLPNPLLTRIDTLEKQLESVTKSPLREGETGFHPDDIQKLIDDRNQITSEIEQLEQQRAGLETQYQNAQQQVAQAQQQLNAIEEDVELKNEQFVNAQQNLEDVQNEISISRAQLAGLQSETDRLQNLVGRLEEANQRRMQTKDALLAGVRQLEIAVKEGLPLTPAKYSREERVQAVEDLKGKIENANYVTPDIMREYTRLQLQEQEIGEARDYFFARIPVKDRFGSTTVQWAECVMNGNMSVFYRTLDGKHIGVYQNVAESGPPDYAFREDLPKVVQEQVQEEIVSMRPQDWPDKIQALAMHEVGEEPTSQFQQYYESLSPRM